MRVEVFDAWFGRIIRADCGHVGARARQRRGQLSCAFGGSRRQQVRRVSRARYGRGRGKGEQRAEEIILIALRVSRIGT